MRFGTVASGRVAMSLLAAIGVIVTARALPVGEFGDLTLLLALGVIAANVADSGYAWKLSELAARSPEASRSAFVAVVVRRLVIGLFASAALVGAYVPVAHNRSIVIPLLFVPSLMASIVHTSGVAALRSLGVVWVDAVNDVGGRALFLVFALIALQQGFGLHVIVAAYSAVDVVAAVGVGAFALRRLPRLARADRAELHVARMFGIAVGAAISVLYFRIDLWMLAALSDRTSAAVGIYGAAVRVADAVVLPASAASALAIPLVMRHTGGEQRVARHRLTWVTAGAVVALGAIVFAAAPWVAHTLLGAAYADVVPVTRILVLAGIPTAVAYVHMPLLAVRRPWELARMWAVALIGNVALDAIAIPRWGARGAAAVTLLCQIGVAMWLRARCERLDDEPDEPARTEAAGLDSEPEPQVMSSMR
jgi:O-antigen/teichoic acid export membrane protein